MMGMAPWQLGRGVVGGFSKPRLIGSGVPSDSLGELGNYYYDSSANRWYLKRWVGNFDGTDVALPSSEPPIGSYFIARAVFKTQASMGSSSRVDIMGRELSFKLRTSANYLSLLLGTGSAWNFNSELVGLSDLTWYRVEVDTLTELGRLKINLNGTEIMNVVHGKAVGASESKFRIGTVTNSTVSRPIAFAEYCGSRWRINEGSGTVLADESGLGRPCSVGDAAPTTFWAQAWVPMDLLS